ncbi:hypothetical protein BOX15_Mlig002667g1 [Macrostomum lignano]|uniref:Uncharacterized protein n=2 Tax=Macrostomum lignano TaxID=282301 RepID=A0A267EQM4_9PLAT|nr:hypothetical protein BOX15_Mlig002667g1 [Macrostomum lignano]
MFQKSSDIFLALFLLPLLALSSLAEVKEEGDVLVLGKDNFQEVVNEKETLLVEFYAPWCGHCKQLEPQYSAAATRLKAKGIALAKVDATVHESLAAQHEVQGYPTMKIYKKAFPGEFFDYNGPRDTEGIVKFMETVALPDWKPPRVLKGLHKLAKANLTEQLDKQSAWLVGFFDPAAADRSDTLALLDAAADQLKMGREPKAVGYVEVAGEDAELAQLYGATSLPTYLVIKRDSQRPVRFIHEATGQALAGFYQAHTVPDSVIRAKSLAELDSIASGTESLLIGHFDSIESAEFLANFLRESSHVHLNRVEGALIESGDLAKQLGLQINTIYLRKPVKLTAEGEASLVKYSGSQSSGAELLKFYEANKLPLVGQYNFGSKETYLSSQLPVCLFFLTVDFSGELRTSTRMWHSKFAKVAARFSGKALFAMADDEQEEDEAKKFKFEDSGSDLNLGCYGTDKRRFASELDSFDADEIAEFVSSVLAGRATPVVRSATARASQSGPLLYLTGASFQEQVLAAGRPSCLVLQCDRDKPECSDAILQLSEFAASPATKAAFPGLTVGHLDTALNDAPGAYFFNPTERSPTLLLLAAAGRKDSPIRFNGSGFDSGQLEKFLKANLPAGKEEL